MAHGTITAGTAAHANNAAATPTNPTQGAGDTLLCWAVIRSSTGTLAVSGTGWTDADGITNPIALQGAGRLYLFQNETDGAGNPTVTPSGGAAGVTVSAGVLNLHGRDKAQNFSLGTVSLNATNSTTIAFAQNSTSIDNGNAIIAIGHKLDDWSAAPGTLAGQTAGLTWAQLHRESTTVGNDQSVAVDYAINSTGSAYTAGTGATMTGTWSASAQSAGVYLESVGAAAAAYSLAAAAGSFALTGQTATLAVKMPAAAGSFALTGNAAALTAARKLTAAAGAFVLTGNAAALSHGYILPAAAGSFALTGQPAALPVTRRLVASAGAFILTGQAATLVRGYRMAGAAGTFVLTGNAAGLMLTRRLSTAAGSFVLTGQSATFIRSRRLVAAAGAFTLTGNAAAFLRGKTLHASAGAFSLYGYPMNFTPIRNVLFPSARPSIVAVSLAALPAAPVVATRIAPAAPAAVAFAEAPPAATLH